MRVSDRTARIHSNAAKGLKVGGWYREPVRHGLAAKGIKTATNAQENLASQMIRSENRALQNLDDAIIRNYKGMEYYKDLTDGLWKVKDKNGDVFVVALDDSKGSGARSIVKSANNEATAKKYIDWVSPKGDADKDGIQNSLDCEPLNPNKQGVFDGLKKKVQAYEEKRDEKKLGQYKEESAKLQKEIEEKKTALDKKLAVEKQKLSAKRKLETEKRALEKKKQDLKKIDDELNREKIAAKEERKKEWKAFKKGAGAFFKDVKSAIKYKTISRKTPPPKGSKGWHKYTSQWDGETEWVKRVKR